MNKKRTIKENIRNFFQGLVPGVEIKGKPGKRMNKWIKAHNIKITHIPDGVRIEK